MQGIPSAWVACTYYFRADGLALNAEYLCLQKPNFNSYVDLYHEKNQLKMFRVLECEVSREWARVSRSSVARQFPGTEVHP